MAGSRTAARRAAAKTGLREHALAVVDAAIAFHHTGVADAGDWHLEAAHPTPAGTLIPDAVVLLADGHTAWRNPRGVSPTTSREISCAVRPS